MPVNFLSNTETKLLVDGINERFSINLSIFSTTSFQRRAHLFFVNHNIESSNEFLRRVEKEDRLLKFFLKEMTVSETEMFRDPEFWSFLSDNILINLLSKKDKIRIWIPDSTTGEEFYSLSILLHEKLFFDRVHIIVSSTNLLSLNFIKEGTYNSKSMEHNKANFVRFKGFDSKFSKYSSDIGGKKRMIPELTNNVEFVKYNMFRDTPPTDIDFILYRNRFLYYTAKAKSYMINILTKSLNNEGMLAVGIKENLLTKEGELKLYNENEQVYIKKI